MNISDLLRSEHVLLDFLARDKWEAIERMVDHLIASGAIPAAARWRVVDALVAREHVASTGLEHGVAIPHATVGALTAPAAAVAVSRTGVPFEAIDGQDATILILLVIPQQMLGRHMRTLAAVARLLSSEEMRQEIRQATRPETVIEAIRREETKGAPTATGGT